VLYGNTIRAVAASRASRSTIDQCASTGLVEPLWNSLVHFNSSEFRNFLAVRNSELREVLFTISSADSRKDRGAIAEFWSRFGARSGPLVEKNITIKMTAHGAGRSVLT
jgi:hypothetical protein